MPYRCLKTWLCSLAALWCLAGWAQAQPQPPPAAKAPAPPPPVVVQLKLEGFTAVPADKALAVMETKGPKVIQLTDLPRYDPQALQRDLDRLRELFKEYGFFEARVEASVARRKRPEGDQVSITIRAIQGRPVLVDEVRLVFPNQDERRNWEKQLRKVIPIKLGQRFSLTQYETGKANLGITLSSQAHPKARVLGQVRVYQQNYRAVVIYDIDPGPRLLFGPNRVVNNRRITTHQILRETTYSRGQPFDLQALRATERALLSTGFFNSVSIKPDYDHISGSQVPIIIEVFESKPHSLRLSLGYGTWDEYRIRLSLINRSLLGWGETITVEGKYSHIYRGIVGRFELPHLFNRWSKLVIYGGQEQKDDEAYTNRRMFLRPVIEYRLIGSWSWYLGYNVENNELVELRADVPDPDFERAVHFISSIPVGVKFDNRDNPLNPTRGTFFRLELELSHRSLGSEVNFLRPVAELRQVIPLGRRWYLAGRIKGGFVQTLGGTDRVPLIRRFFLGGADSVRGYPYQRLGPLDQGGVPLGGVAAVEGSVELRFPLVGDLGGVIFVDAGNTWADIDLEVPTIYYTAGFGLRYQTPVGPLRLDFGYQINPPPGDHLSRYEFYITVGQAF